jgi:hypothetical protein
MAFHGYKFFINQSAEAAPHPYNLQFVKYGGAHHSAYGGIHSRRIAA